MPSAKAPSSSAGATATDFRKPSTSVNQSRTNRTSRSSSARSTKSSCLPMRSGRPPVGSADRRQRSSAPSAEDFAPRTVSPRGVCARARPARVAEHLDARSSAARWRRRASTSSSGPCSKLTTRQPGGRVGRGPRRRRRRHRGTRPRRRRTRPSIVASDQVAPGSGVAEPSVELAPADQLVVAERAAVADAGADRGHRDDPDGDRDGRGEQPAQRHVAEARVGSPPPWCPRRPLRARLGEG